MRVLLLLLLSAVLVAGCEDRESPASPSPAPSTTTVPAPTPRALLRPIGTHQFINCTFQGTCTFIAALVNDGSGCATQVTGVIRLFDQLGIQLGGPYRFSLPTQQIVQPAERINYSASFVPFTQAVLVVSYDTATNWIDTSCR